VLKLNVVNWLCIIKTKSSDGAYSENK